MCYAFSYLSAPKAIVDDDPDVLELSANDLIAAWLEKKGQNTLSETASTRPPNSTSDHLSEGSEGEKSGGSEQLELKTSSSSKRSSCKRSRGRKAKAIERVRAKYAAEGMVWVPRATLS
jgi:hypothetical protein